MTSQAAVELKGGMYTLLSIQIQSIEQEAIELALKNKVQQAPGFFKDTPVVVDLSPVEHMEELDTDQLLATIRQHNLVAIAAINILFPVPGIPYPIKTGINPPSS